MFVLWNRLIIENRKGNPWYFILLDEMNSMKF